jgi:hypothetical protein
MPKKLPQKRKAAPLRRPRSRRVGSEDALPTEDNVASKQIELNVSNAEVEVDVPVDDFAGIPRMTSEECNDLKILDLERDNSRQAFRLSELEINQLDRNYKDITEEYKRKRQAKLAEREAFSNKVLAVQKQYEAFIKALCEKHGLEPTQTTYDVDTGILRDLRPDQPTASKESLSETTHTLPN